MFYYLFEGELVAGPARMDARPFRSVSSVVEISPSRENPIFFQFWYRGVDPSIKLVRDVATGRYRMVAILPGAVREEVMIDESSQYRLISRIWLAGESDFFDFLAMVEKELHLSIELIGVTKNPDRSNSMTITPDEDDL